VVSASFGNKLKQLNQEEISFTVEVYPGLRSRRQSDPEYQQLTEKGLYKKRGRGPY